MSSSKFPCTYERQVYIIMSPLYWAMVVIICLVLLWPVDAINLCCTIAGPSYTVSAQHKSNMICVFYLCYCILVFVWDKDTSSICTVIVTTTLCLMLGHHLRVWININPALGHRSHLCLVSVSTMHWPNIGLPLVHCLRHRSNIRKTLGRCRPIVFTLWDWCMSIVYDAGPT